MKKLVSIVCLIVFILSGSPFSYAISCSSPISNDAYSKKTLKLVDEFIVDIHTNSNNPPNITVAYYFYDK